MQQFSQPALIEDTRRHCPICDSTNTGAGYNGKKRVDGETVDLGSCSCLDCGARWQEAYYRRSGRTVNTDVQPGSIRQQPHAAFGVRTSNSARPFEHHSAAWYRVGTKDIRGLTARERDLLAQLRAWSAALGPPWVRSKRRA